jgi:2-oxoisovalerate dehydrogenase E1 component beta subunit
VLQGEHLPGIGMNQVYETNTVPQLHHVRDALRAVAEDAA